MDEQRREDRQLWIIGILLGVFGNMLVSAAVEIANTSGFIQTLWTIVLAISWIFFMRTLSESAKKFGFNLPIRKITIATYGFLAFLVIWAFVVFLVLPNFT